MPRVRVERARQALIAVIAIRCRIAIGIGLELPFAVREVSVGRVSDRARSRIARRRKGESRGRRRARGEARRRINPSATAAPRCDNLSGSVVRRRRLTSIAILHHARTPRRVVRILSHVAFGICLRPDLPG